MKVNNNPSELSKDIIKILGSNGQCQVECGGAAPPA
jgi:hypothetical protein